MGYNPQIGHRKNDYVPFFFECQTPECHNSRTELFYYVEGTKSIISGACPKCKEKYSFSFNTSKPDLSDIILNITHRVDSRQAIVNNVIPVSLHIGGPGETSYFAEVAPALRVLKIPVPVFYRYIRVFYNTPWNELIASLLKENGYFSVLDDELFKGIASWVEANKKNNEKQINESLERIRKHLDDIYEKLVLNENELKTEVELIKKQLSTSKNRNELIKTLKEKEKQLQLIENYLSLAYGQYAPEKYGQEVSWLWIDFALSANVKSIASVYQRMYNLYTPNSSTYFVNL